MTGIELAPKEMAEPGSPEHTRIITASKVAPMMRDSETGEYLGIGYDTAYDTYMYMTGQEVKDTTNMEDMFRYGHAAEHFARYWLKDIDPSWRLSPKEVAFTDPALPFPNQGTLDIRASKGRARKFIEVKAPRVDRGVEDAWLVQATMNMALSGYHQCEIMVVPHYGEVAIYPLEFDPELWGAIKRDAAHFWQLIERGTPPDMQGSQLYRKQKAKIQPDNNADPLVLNEGYTERYEDAVLALKDAEAHLAVVENEIIDQMGNAPWVNGADGRKIVSRVAGRFSEKRVPEQFRTDERFFTSKFDSQKLKKEFPSIYEEAKGDYSFKFEKKAWTTT